MSKKNSKDESSQSKPVPDPEPQPKPESREESKAEVIIDVTESGWKQQNALMFLGQVEGKKTWYCTGCRFVTQSPAGASKHAEDHGLTLPFGRTDATKPKVESPIEVEGQKKGMTATELRSILQAQHGGVSALIDPADLALQINAEEEAKHIRELIKNPYVLYMFSKMRDQRIIFPDWTIADALREGFLVLADRLGCYASFGQDLQKLQQDPHWSNVAIKVAEAWEAADAEEALAQSKSTVVPTPEAKS